MRIRHEKLGLRKKELQNLVGASRGTLLELQASESKYRKALEKNRLEIEVNESAFKMVYEVINILGLTGRDFGKFQKELDQYLNRVNNTSTVLQFSNGVNKKKSSNEKIVSENNRSSNTRNTANSYKQ